MEDRHYLSEPRPIEGLDLLTWDVDVMREGVDQPIMTIRLDSNNLPPRKRKKKVVWQLPDSLDQTPKFGKEDKLRILELFRLHKKSTKKEKRKSQPGDNEAGGSPPEKTHDPDEATTPTKANESSMSTSAVISPNSSSMMTQSKSASPPSSSNDLRSQNRGDYDGPPGFERLSLEEKKEESPLSEAIREEKAVEAALSPSPSHLQHPPGIPSLGRDSPALVSPTRCQAPPGLPPLASYFCIPPPSPNTPPMNLSEVVTQSYYLMLTHGHVQDLKRYYTPTATKSLTVGGAHAICSSEEDKDHQLQSLVGIVVAIRGVLQQTIPMTTFTPSPAFGSPPNPVLVVITGVCVQPHALPFCHTLVLVAQPNGYQIQNDALCFLTADSPAGTTT